MNVAQLIRRSNLTNLEGFTSTNLSAEIVSVALAEVPRLKELSLSFFEDRTPSMDELITAIALGDLVPNIQTLQLTSSRFSRWCKITIWCFPEEVRPGFLDIFVAILRQNRVSISFEVDG